MPYVIIQCGSSARGDANNNSDVDLVCIWSENQPDFKKITAEYGDIMFYSQETIRRMKEKGSLFLTHLDVDGIYVTGDRSLLDNFKNFRPKKHHLAKQLSHTKKFIQNIQWYPNNAIGKLWLCDVLYVSLRSCIYCKNAINKIYSFGYLGALSEHGLSEQDIKIMLDIREGKYLYRSQNLKKPLKNESLNLNIDSIKYICQVITGYPLQLSPGGSTNWKKIKDTDYWSERLIERAILNGEYLDEKFLLNIRKHNYHKFEIKSEIAKIIENHT